MEADIEAAGALATASLAAGAIEGAGEAKHTNDQHANCANCGTPLTGRYCHACGQAAHIHHSLLHLCEEVLHGVLHFDAKGWRTVPLLVVHPGRLTRRYIDGQRTRYVSPLALFLFTMFLMFFVFSFAGGSHKTPEMLSDEERAELARDAKEVESEDNSAVTPSDAASAAGLSAPAGGAAAVKRKKPHSAIGQAIARQLENKELALYKLKNTAYKFSFMLIPISLPFLWLMFVWRRGVRVYDHAVFSLYSLSFMALLFSTTALLAMSPLDAPIWLIVMVVPPVHMFVQLRGTYALSNVSALWRTFALLLVAGTVFLLFLLFVAVMSAS